MVGLTVDTGSSVAEGSQCAPFSDSRWRAESTVGSYGLSLELRQQRDTFFPFTIYVVTGESGTSE